MVDHDNEPNPYQSPTTGYRPWFRWSRVPYGFYCGIRGYYRQMRADGGSIMGHLACWAVIFLFLTVVSLLIALIVNSLVHLALA